MKIVESLSELNIEEKFFPIFFWRKWIDFEEKTGANIKLFFSEEYNTVIVFKIEKLKFLNKGTYLWIPLDKNGKSLTKEIESNSCNELHSFLKANNSVDIILPPLHFVNFKSIPKNSLGFGLDIIKLSISNEEDNILKKMSSNYRNEIRKAIKEGVYTKFDLTYLNQFYKLYAETHTRQSLVYQPEDYFKKFIEKLSENVIIGLSLKDSNKEGAIFTLFDNSNAYYLYGGSAEKPILHGSNKLLMYESIKLLRDRGIEFLIMGGYRNNTESSAKHSGIQQYKMRFGCELDHGFHFIHIVNPLKYRLFEFLIKAKGVLTGKDLSLINLKGIEIIK